MKTLILALSAALTIGLVSTPATAATSPQREVYKVVYHWCPTNPYGGKGYPTSYESFHNRDKAVKAFDRADRWGIWPTHYGWLCKLTLKHIWRHGLARRTVFIIRF